MTEPQTTLNNDWEVIRKQMSITKIPRVNWVKIFGRTLTNIIAQYKQLGYNSAQTIKTIIGMLMVRGYHDDELNRRVRIGVCSRYGEARSMERKGKEII